MADLSRRRLLIIAGGAITATAVYPFIEPYFVDINEILIPLGLNLRVLHLTDLHLRDFSFKDEAFAIISKLSSNVDLTFITGDFYDEGTESLDLVKKYVSRIKGIKIGVLGNHEHWASNKFPLECGLQVLEDAGVRILINEKINFGGKSIGGIDWYEDENNIGREYLSEIGEVDILLSHTPDIIGLEPKAKLVLAGHTHGGQVDFPLFGPLWIPSKYGAKYAKGLFKIENTYMYVNRGLGEMAPIRFNSRREIVTITL